MDGGTIFTMSKDSRDGEIDRLRRRNVDLRAKAKGLERAIEDQEGTIAQLREQCETYRVQLEEVEAVVPDEDEAEVIEPVQIHQAPPTRTRPTAGWALGMLGVGFALGAVTHFVASYEPQRTEPAAVVQTVDPNETTQFECLDGSWVYDRELCPSLPDFTLLPGETPNSEEPIVITQYQCLDDSIVSDRYDCPEPSAEPDILYQCFNGELQPEFDLCPPPPVDEEPTDLVFSADIHPLEGYSLQGTPLKYDKLASVLDGFDKDDIAHYQSLLEAFTCGTSNIIIHPRRGDKVASYQPKSLRDQLEATYRTTVFDGARPSLMYGSEDQPGVVDLLLTWLDRSENPLNFRLYPINCGDEQ